VLINEYRNKVDSPTQAKFNNKRKRQNINDFRTRCSRLEDTSKKSHVECCQKNRKVTTVDERS
jgi:hypothetical protein